MLNVERGFATTDGYQWAAELASLFRCKRLGGGLETFAPDGPIVNDAIDNGNYIELSVLVPYRYQFDDAGSASAAVADLTLGGDPLTLGGDQLVLGE